MYYIQDVDRPSLYWAGDCLFGKLEFRTAKWGGPKLYGGIDYIISDGIQFNNPPVTPYSFSSQEQAERAVQYVPRIFNVRIVGE